MDVFFLLSDVQCCKCTPWPDKAQSMLLPAHRSCFLNSEWTSWGKVHLQSTRLQLPRTWSLTFTLSPGQVMCHWKGQTTLRSSGSLDNPCIWGVELGREVKGNQNCSADFVDESINRTAACCVTGGIAKVASICRAPCVASSSTGGTCCVDMSSHAMEQWSAQKIVCDKVVKSEQLLTWQMSLNVWRAYNTYHNICKWGFDIISS